MNDKVQEFLSGRGMSGTLNPKDAIGSNKLPLELWPASASAVGCLALLDGMLKYGRTNWRAAEVLASIYVAALRRHVDDYHEGITIDPVSKLPVLGHIIANGAILFDATMTGTLVDDRQYPGKNGERYHALVEELTPHVARLKAMHAGRAPRHYTIADAPGPTTREETIHVVVGVVVQGRRVLLQQRSWDDENFGGAWECPGGGVEPGESDHAALRRELGEELGISAAPIGISAVPIWRGQIVGYKSMRHDFRFYLVDKWSGDPSPLDGQPGMDWFAVNKPPMGLTPANQLAWPEIVKHVSSMPPTRSRRNPITSRNPPPMKREKRK